MTAEPIVRDAESPDGPGGTPDPVDPPGGVWSPGRRRLTAALVLTITLVAFESLAIATVMPVVADDLGGLGLYGWVFSGFFLGSLLGIVLAGRAADRLGTRRPFAVGLALFAAGLIVGGAAQSMPMLVAGRVAQGMGAGAIPAVAYTTVGRSYPATIRPRVFFVFSTAWVVPGVVGPAAASAIEGAASWRVVFLALLPLVGLAAALALPVLSAGVPGTAGDRAAGTTVGTTAATAEAPADDERRRDAFVLVAGVALVLAGLGAHQAWLAVALVAAGGPPAAWAFVRLVPEGTVALHRGLPAAVAARGILTFAFFGTDAYVSLAITDARDQPLWLAGVALTGATLAWTTGAWIQQRLVVQRGPRWLVRRGLAVVAAGLVLMMVSLGPVPVALAVAAWSVGGLGMGLSYAPISVTVLGTAAPGQEGRASASLQLTDVLGVSLGTGMAGVFVALGDGRGWATGSSLTIAFVVTLAAALGGVAAAGRLPRSLPGTAAP
ncbi:MAG TPA: MFS transporter [Acidimicrobiales bacterium]|nr:MFS transporter [Acidimicrobiales bacterium]